jgi:hypothetical protein
MRKCFATLCIGSLLTLAISLSTSSASGQTPVAIPVLKAQGSARDTIDDSNGPLPKARSSSTAAPLSCSTASPNKVTITECSTTLLPLLSATDGTALSATSYLETIQAVNGVDPNPPLQILNQANSTGGATLPTPFTNGMGGIDIFQNAAATSTMNYPSPYFQICAQQWLGTSPSSEPGCWRLRVDAGSGANPQDVIEWSRPTPSSTTNQTGNITMLFPNAINLAAAGQITVGPEPTSSASATTPSTFTGQTNTTVTTTTATAAGGITIEPGQLQSSFTGSAEGPLQVLQSYLVSSTSGTNGRLACPSGTAQSVQVCTATGAAEKWVGVFNSGIPGQLALQPPPNTGATLTPVRYGRVPIHSTGSVTFSNGDFVCKDDATASYVVNSATACPVGESIGIAVGDPDSSTSHLVDLVPTASVLLSSYWTNGPTMGSVGLTSSGIQWVYGLVIPTQLAAGSIVLDVATPDGSNSYSVGIFAISNSTTACMAITPPCAALVAHIPAQSFGTTGVNAPIAFNEGTVTFPPGKYYLGFTGTATTLKLSAMVSTLIPLGASMEGPTTSGNQLGQFSLPADSWTTTAEPVIALAP